MSMVVRATQTDRNEGGAHKHPNSGHKHPQHSGVHVGKFDSLQICELTFRALHVATNIALLTARRSLPVRLKDCTSCCRLTLDILFSRRHL